MWSKFSSWIFSTYRAPYTLYRKIQIYTSTWKANYICVNDSLFILIKSLKRIADFHYPCHCGRLHWVKKLPKKSWFPKIPKTMWCSYMDPSTFGNFKELRFFILFLLLFFFLVLGPKVAEGNQYTTITTGATRIHLWSLGKWRAWHPHLSVLLTMKLCPRSSSPAQCICTAHRTRSWIVKEIKKQYVMSINIGYRLMTIKGITKIIAIIVMMGLEKLGPSDDLRV